MAPEYVYYGFATENGLQGVFRMVKDDDAETLTLERPDGDGIWTDDPDLIAELREPGVHPISEEEAMAFLTPEHAPGDPPLPERPITPPVPEPPAPTTF